MKDPEDQAEADFTPSAGPPSPSAGNEHTEPPGAGGGKQWALRDPLLAVFVFLALLLLLSDALPFLWLGREVRAVVGAVWMLGTATALGLWLMERQRGLIPGRELLQACALGVGVYAYGMFLLGALGLWRDGWVWAFFLALQLVALPNWGLLLRSLRVRWAGAQGEPWSVLHALGVVFGGTMALLALLYAFLPPMSFDALEYHLGVPWAYWQGGGMRFLPHLFFANFPMNVEMVFTLGWRIAGEGGIKVLHWAFALLTAAGVYTWLRRPLGRGGALLGALLFFTSGQVISLAVSSKIDLVVTFFSFLAFESFWRWLHGGNRREGLLCGVFCGLAAGSKYSVVGVVALPIGVGFLLCLLARIRGKDQWPALLSFGLALGLLFAPWAIRNTLYQGNPVFPLAYPALGGKTMDDEFHRFMKVTTDATWPEELEQLRGMPPGPLQVEQGWSILTRKEVLPTLFIALLIPLLLGGLDRRMSAAYVVVLLGWLAWVILSRPLPRYLVPLYPAMAGLFLLAFERIGRRSVVRIGRGLLVVLLVNHFLAFGGFIAGLPSAADYLSSHYLAPEGFLFRSLPHLEAIDFLNRSVSRKQARVLFVAEARGYGCKVPYDLNTVYDRAIILQVVGQDPRPERWPALLRQAGYTHILFNPIELARYRRTFEASGWKEGERIEAVMNLLERDGGLRPLFVSPPTSGGRIQVYEILPDE